MSGLREAIEALADEWGAVTDPNEARGIWLCSDRLRYILDKTAADTTPAGDTEAVERAADALVRANAVLNSYGIRGQLWHDLNAIIGPAIVDLAGDTIETGKAGVSDAETLAAEPGQSVAEPADRVMHPGTLATRDPS